MSSSLSRPPTRDGALEVPLPHHPSPLLNSPSSITSFANTLKDRKPSFTRKPSTTFSTSPRRRASSNAIVTDSAAPPALPDYALHLTAAVRDSSVPTNAAAAVLTPTSPDSFARMLTRTPTAASVAQMPSLHSMPPPTPIGNGGGFWQPSDASMVHQQIVDLVNKRITTLDYLRKAHQGHVFWFNAYLLDKQDLSRMPCFDPRKLSRKATNYLLLGLSLPVVVDLNSSSPADLLRNLSLLLSEFDSFQQLRNSDSTASLSRARLPNMFRRPGGKGRRSTSAADTLEDAFSAAAAPSNPNNSFSSMTNGSNSANGAATSAPSVMNFAASESDLLPGEEYAHLLTPSLPFEPDYFETFATLCDVLIDSYTRFLALIPTTRECTASVAELFAKADARVRKIIVQGVVKEFEDSSRTNVRSEVASIGKVVLGGLM